MSPIDDFLRQYIERHCGTCTVCPLTVLRCMIRAGASGYIGSFIAVQLGKAGVKTTALVRNISSDDAARKEKLENLKAAGVKLLEGSVDAEVDELVKILKGFDTVISAISGVHNNTPG